MFTAEKYPEARFEGYRIEVARQGRASLAVRRLNRVLTVFHPAEGKVAVFLPRPAPLPSVGDLRRVWEAQGCPAVHLPTADETVLFGRTVKLQRMPFAGWEDVRLADGTLTLCFKKAPSPAAEEQLLRGFMMKQTELRAQAFFRERLEPRITVRPARIIARQLGRRILGQCTCDGEVRIDPRHACWPEEVLLSTLAHELTHLKHFDHSTAFWQEQTRLLPDWLELSLRMP